MSANTSETNLAAMFAPLTTVGPEALERLHVALEGAADREGILDVAYRTIDTPIGTLLLAATEKGLVRVAYDSEDHDVVSPAPGRWPCGTRSSPAMLRRSRPPAVPGRPAWRPGTSRTRRRLRLSDRPRRGRHGARSRRAR